MSSGPRRTADGAGTPQVDQAFASATRALTIKYIRLLRLRHFLDDICEVAQQTRQIAYQVRMMKRIQEVFREFLDFFVIGLWLFGSNIVMDGRQWQDLVDR